MISNVSNSHVNVGTGNSISILELAKLMIKISKLDVTPIMSEALEGDIEKSQSDSSLARKSFDWKPERKLEEWLEEII